MRRISFIYIKFQREFHVGAYALWRDAQINGVKLGLKLGFWSVGVKFPHDQTLAARMIETLKK